MLNRVRTVLLVAVTLALPATTQALVVEFSEVPLPNLTLLDGTLHYAAFGLGFDDTTFLAIDSRFVGAGVDNQGITTTGGGDNLMSVVFTNAATSVTFSWVTISSNAFYADAFDAADTLIGSYFAPAVGATTYGTGAFSGIGPINRITFHDGEGQIGVGRLEYEPVPEPATIGLLGLGLLGVATRRRRS